jgi:hypothetical protein
MSDPQDSWLEREGKRLEKAKQNPSREEIYDEMTSHIKGDKPTTGVWELYIFPGGLVGKVKHRWQAYLWMYLRLFSWGEKRAIHSETKEHIVL